MRCAAICWGLVSSLASADDEVQQVLDAWSQRQREIYSADFQVSGTSVLEPGYFPGLTGVGRGEEKPVPHRPTTLPFKTRLVIDRRRGGLHRDETSNIRVPDGENSAAWRPWRRLIVFDGREWNRLERQVRFIGQPPGQDGSQYQLAISKDPTRSIVFSVEYNPMLYCLGIIHPGLIFEWGELKPEFRRQDFRLDRIAEFDGHECLVIEAGPDARGHRKKFWVDRSDPRLIRQSVYYELTDPDAFWLTTQIEYDDASEDAIPTRWKIQRVNFATAKSAVHVLKMDTAKLNVFVPRSLLTVAPKPGTRVTDHRKPRESRRYIVE